MMRWLLSCHPAVFIFTLAMAVRAFLAFIFYGSTDVSSFIAINSHTFNQTLQGYPYLIWCAFPTFPWYLWLSGWLSVMTPLPLAFCFKLIPLFFDALLAVLLYQLVSSIRQKDAWAVGMLYALCPVSLMITCIHGQWDAMPLFCLILALFARHFIRNADVGYALHGALFALSFLLKPLSLILLPFFFTPFAKLAQQCGRAWVWMCTGALMLCGIVCACFVYFKMQRSFTINELIALCSSGIGLYVCVAICVLAAGLMLYAAPWRHFSASFKHFLCLQGLATLGLCAMIATCFVGFVLYGFNIVSMFDKIFRYLNTGITTHGLPFSYPFNQGFLLEVLKNRFWMMGLIGGVAWLYYKQRIDVFIGMLLSFLIVFSFGTLSPQYLIWVTPFFLIAGLYRLFAGYTFLVTLFCIFYYMHPFANPVVPYQSMLSFAPLHGWNWLLPPVWMTRDTLLPVVHLLGNYLLPLYCMGTVVYVLMRSNQNVVYASMQSVRSVFPYLAVLVGLTGVIGVLMLVFGVAGLAPTFNVLVDQRFERYVTYAIDGCLSGAYGAWTPLNIVHLLVVLLLGWCCYACVIACRNKKS